MYDIVIVLVLLALGYIAGSVAESRHYASIVRREREHLGLPLATFKALPEDHGPVRSSEFVTGSVVVSVDYFKRFLAGLRNIFGGEVKSYATLVDRGRREALLRMIECAPGADIILNVRLETSSIGKSAQRSNSIGSIEVLAYGTAVFFEKP